MARPTSGPLSRPGHQALADEGVERILSCRRPPAWIPLEMSQWRTRLLDAQLEKFFKRVDLTLQAVCEYPCLSAGQMNAETLGQSDDLFGLRTL